MKPLLSVLIDTYNHERYIEQTVLSAIEQDFPAGDYEILVVDDGSADRTPDIVRKFAPRVRLLQKKNGGQASAFNAGYREITGEIVAFLDGDDWFAPGKLAAVASALEQHPEIAAVGHGRYDLNEETRETKLYVPPQAKFMHLATAEAARQAARDWSFVLMGSLTVRKSALDRIMPVPESLVICADVPISWGAVAGGAVVLPQPLFYYRHHSANLFSPGQSNPAQMRRKYEIAEMAFESAESLLLRLGVRPDSVRALVDPPWVEHSRLRLSYFGGSRLKTLKTEMRGFRSEYVNPSWPYRMFKYSVVAAATLLLPPRKFYELKGWYGRKHLGRVRDQFVSAR